MVLALLRRPHRRRRRRHRRRRRRRRLSLSEQKCQAFLKADPFSPSFLLFFV